jgi:hypothetical protein
MGVSLLEVTAKTWMHAVLGVEAGKVNYDELEAMLSGYVDCQVDGGLAAIKRGLRTHAVDGVGVGLLAALRPHLANVIVAGRGVSVERRKESA